VEAPRPGTIGRAHLVRRQPEPDFLGAVGGPFDVEVNDRHVYWTYDRELRSSPWGSGPPRRAIARARLDGTHVRPRFVSFTNETATGLAVGRGHVYWTDKLRIGRARLDGSRIQRNFIDLRRRGGRTRSIGDVAVGRKFLYWTAVAGEQGQIGRARLDGSRADPSFVRLQPLARWPMDLAVHGKHIFWTARNEGGDRLSTYDVGRATQRGRAVEQQLVALDRHIPGDVAAADGRVYWTWAQLTRIGEDEGGPRSTGIGRAYADGRDVTHDFIGLAPDANPLGLAVGR
jgi:hypothetical protein